ncbi:MAG: TIR domain-containing protein, partial [Pseudomonadota bacterium]|nr:TIR domain-containing protein [Pseudomonadota bacterium]
MAKTRIFISHSAKDDPFAAWVRDRLFDRLTQQGFDVLLDKARLDPGDEWRARLHQWLAECDGAVLLFSRKALESDWVLKESTILTWRRSQNPRLLVVPALLGDVDPAATANNHFGPLQVAELQFARLDSAAETEANAERLADIIAARFDNFAANDPDPYVSRWIKDLAVNLKGAAPEHLLGAKDILQIHDSDWPGTPHEQALVLACQFLMTDIQKAFQALRELSNSLSEERLDRLISKIAPVWVRQEAARNILPVITLPEDERFLAINADWQ